MDKFLRKILYLNQNDEKYIETKPIQDFEISKITTIETAQTMPNANNNNNIKTVLNLNNQIIDTNTVDVDTTTMKQQASIIKRKLFQSKSFLNQTFFNGSISKNSDDMTTNQMVKNVIISINDKQSDNQIDPLIELKNYLELLDEHFQLILQTKNATTITIVHQIHKLIKSYLTTFLKCIELNKEIEKNSYKYDYSDELKYNGYRTLSKIFVKCSEQTLVIVKEMHLKKSSLLFTMKYTLTSTIEELQTWLKLLQKLEILFNISLKMQKLTENSNRLFITEDLIDDYIEENLFRVASTQQEAFFGRTCAFQFCDSLKTPLTACAVALASYNDGYEAFQDNAIGMTAKSLISSTRYMLNPDLRAQKLSKIMKNANVEFCKAFWQLTETSLAQVGSNLMTPNVLVNIVKTLDLVPLKITDAKNEQITINPPVSVEGEKSVLNIRILSAEFRDGMQDLDKGFFESCINANVRSITPKSPYLVLHAHGGGFIAHSSKSHEIYLRPWCRDLHVPIVSIDYSLAPEHPFPKSSEECFYVYAWCLINKDLLGWTGEKIVCVGDSAGGVLVTNIVQRAITYDIRIPDALIPIYTPFLLSYSLSPSRLLSVMDPLLNLGILWRCLAAYCGIDFKSVQNSKILPKLTYSKSFDDNLVTRDANVANRVEITDDQIILKPSELNDHTTKTDELKRKSSKTHKNLVKSNSDSQIEERRLAFEASADLFNATITLKKQEKLDNLRKLIGDSVYLIELLRYHPLPRNPYMSPLLCDDEVLKKFPKTHLIACNDPFMDDTLEMAKKLHTNSVNYDLLIIDNGSPHGFLNMKNLCEETRVASAQVFNVIETIINDFKK